VLDILNEKANTHGMVEPDQKIFCYFYRYNRNDIMENDLLTKTNLSVQYLHAVVLKIINWKHSQFLLEGASYVACQKYWKSELQFQLDPP